MKTNQIMLRRMGAMTVQQRTGDAYFNATELIRSYNEMTAHLVEIDGALETTAEVLNLRENNFPIPHSVVCKNVEVEEVENQPIAKYPHLGVFKKSLDKFMKSQQTEDFINSIAKNEGLNIRDVVKTTRGKNGGTWVHPMLFIDLCMWLDSDFKYKALKFVQDQMLRFRDEAGEAYKTLCQAVARITPKERTREVMASVGRAVNFIMWNKHNDSERNNHATEEEMRLLQEFERRLASLIDDGFITSHDGLIKYLRNQWIKRWNPIK